MHVSPSTKVYSCIRVFVCSWMCIPVYVYSCMCVPRASMPRRHCRRWSQWRRPRGVACVQSQRSTTRDASVVCEGWRASRCRIAPVDECPTWLSWEWCPSVALHRSTRARSLECRWTFYWGRLSAPCTRASALAHETHCLQHHHLLHLGLHLMGRGLCLRHLWKTTALPLIGLCLLGLLMMNLVNGVVLRVWMGEIVLSWVSVLPVGVLDWLNFCVVAGIVVRTLTGLVSMIQHQTRT